MSKIPLIHLLRISTKSHMLRDLYIDTRPIYFFLWLWYIICCESTTSLVVRLPHHLLQIRLRDVAIPLYDYDHENIDGNPRQHTCQSYHNTNFQDDVSRLQTPPCQWLWSILMMALQWMYKVKVTCALAFKTQPTQTRRKGQLELISTWGNSMDQGGLKEGWWMQS